MTRHFEEGVDLLVAGQGLAGSILAMTAVRAGLSVHVADPEPMPGRTASRVAAGLITPLTGARINPGWRLDELLPVARDFYGWAGKLLGRPFFHDSVTCRWFTGEDERRAFIARMEEPRVAKWCGGLIDAALGVRAPWGGFSMIGGGWLEPVPWLEATRAWLLGQAAWSPEAIEEAEIEVDAEHVVWKGVRARHLVFCQGLAAAGSGYFPGLPFRPASGDVLEVTLAGGAPAAVWNSGGKWLAPREDGTCLCGATYGFGEWVARPRPEGAVEIRGFLDGLLAGGYEVTGHRAGVRPILHQSRPVAGFHPDFPRVGMLNGLGSKGVLTAPWAAGQLVDAMISGNALDPELDLAKFPRWAGRPKR